MAEGEQVLPVTHYQIKPGDISNEAMAGILGAVAAYYNEAIKAGFPHADAMEMTKDFHRALIVSGWLRPG